MPISRRLTRAEFEMRPVGQAARCSCGFDAPAVQGDPLENLARIHVASEPDACGLCGHVNAARTAGSPAWLRYNQVERDGVWLYVCAVAYSCAQRQRGRRDGAPVWRGGEPFDPTLLSANPIAVSLDSDYEKITNYWDVQPAVALFQMAAGQLPRRWADIATTAEDQRALLAMVVAQAALHELSSRAIWKWVAAARQAGAPWDQVAAAAGWEDGEAFREEVLRDASAWDWENAEQEATILALLADESAPAGSSGAARP